MRLITFGAGFLVAFLVAGVVASNVFRPAAASTRLAGVSVAVIGYTVTDLGEGRHRLNLTVKINSLRDLNECIGFTLDQPFAARRLDPLPCGCIRAGAGGQMVRLMFDGLTDDDIAFPSHTVVWGIPGGRCGPILGCSGCASSTWPAPRSSSCLPVTFSRRWAPSGPSCRSSHSRRPETLASGLALGDG